MLVDQPCPDRPLKCTNVVENFVSGQIRIEHHVTNLAVGFQILRNDIDVALQEYLVQPPEHSRNIAVNMAEARTERVGLQLDLRKIYGTHRGAATEIIKHFSGYLFADPILRFFGRHEGFEQLPDHLNDSCTQKENVFRIGAFRRETASDLSVRWSETVELRVFVSAAIGRLKQALGTDW